MQISDPVARPGPALTVPVLVLLGTLVLLIRPRRADHAGTQAMPQLDHLIEALRLAKEIEAAAELDFHDRTEGMVEAKRRVQQAEDRMKAARDQANNARLAVHCRIEAQTHSAFEDEVEHNG